MAHVCSFLSYFPAQSPITVLPFFHTAAVWHWPLPPHKSIVFLHFILSFLPEEPTALISLLPPEIVTFVGTAWISSHLWKECTPLGVFTFQTMPLQVLSLCSNLQSSLSARTFQRPAGCCFQASLVFSSVGTRWGAGTSCVSSDCHPGLTDSGETCHTSCKSWSGASQTCAHAQFPEGLQIEKGSDREGHPASLSSPKRGWTYSKHPGTRKMK